MVKQFLRAALIVCIAQVANAGVLYAAPAGYDHILKKTEMIKIGGLKVEVPIDIWLKTRFVEGAAFFDLWADADLSGFQDNAPKIAGGMSRSRKCGDRVRVTSVKLDPQEDKASLCIRVHYQKWQCLQAAMPSLSGFKLTFKKKSVVKTKMVDQKAHICADMWPVVAPDGSEVKLEGKITKNTVTGSAGFFGDLFNARGQFRSKLRREINRAMADLKLPVPDALKSFDPVLDDARFQTREDGSLGMVMTMNVKVTPSELPQILALLSKN